MMHSTTFISFATLVISGVSRKLKLPLQATLIAVAASQVHGADGPDYRLYRCVVLGDSSACPALEKPAPIRIEERVEPGPYAKYLMYLGRSQSDAIAAAVHIGEYPVRRTVQVTVHELTAVEKHDRWLGNRVEPAIGETTLSVVVEKPDALRLGTREAGAQRRP